MKNVMNIDSKNIKGVIESYLSEVYNQEIKVYFVTNKDGDVIAKYKYTIKIGNYEAVISVELNSTDIRSLLEQIIPDFKIEWIGYKLNDDDNKEFLGCTILYEDNQNILKLGK